MNTIARGLCCLLRKFLPFSWIDPNPFVHGFEYANNTLHLIPVSNRNAYCIFKLPQPTPIPYVYAIPAQFQQQLLRLMGQCGTARQPYIWIR